MYTTLRALSPSRNVRTAIAPVAFRKASAASIGRNFATSSSRTRRNLRYTYSPGLIRAFQPGAFFPLHFDSLQAYEWDNVKKTTCGKAAHLNTPQNVFVITGSLQTPRQLLSSCSNIKFVCFCLSKYFFFWRLMAPEYE
jgi:hypothetical protein